MTTLSIGPVRRWRRLTGLFALLLVFASAMPVRAGVRPPPSSGGVVNSSFGTSRACSLSSWTGTGTYAAVELADGDCEATITASTSGSLRSTLQQRFVVDTTRPSLDMFLVPSSNNLGTNFAAQTVALYDSAGNLIYSKSRNNDLAREYRDGSMVAYQFSYDLTRYAGTAVTIRVTATVDPANITSPTSASLRIDFDSPSVAGSGGGPSSGGVGVW